MDIKKIAAVYSYLEDQFDSCTITDSYDRGTGARVFQIDLGGLRRTAVVEKEFFEKNDAAAIPEVLRRFLLAEHLRDCDFPIVVTPSGLSD